VSFVAVSIWERRPEVFAVAEADEKSNSRHQGNVKESSQARSQEFRIKAKRPPDSGRPQAGRKHRWRYADNMSHPTGILSRNQADAETSYCHRACPSELDLAYSSRRHFATMLLGAVDDHPTGDRADTSA